MIRSSRLGIGVVLLVALGAGLLPSATVSAAASRTGPAPARTTDVAALRGPAIAPARASIRPGEVVVTLAPGFRSATGRTLAAAEVGAPPAGRGRVQVLRVPAGSEREAARILADDPAVVSAAPNFLRSATAHAPREVPWGVEAVGAPRRWHADTPNAGRGVRVAIVDSGIDADHPALAGRVARGFDATGTRGQDNCGHGTAVAGVVGAAMDGEGTVGVAPDVTLIPVKVLEYDDVFGCTGDDADIARGILWAADPDRGRADVINLSLSGREQSDVLADAVRQAHRQGVVVVGAAGNRGDIVPMYPAAYPQVISVGGTQRGADGRDEWWPPSNFGTIDVAAPAKDIPLILSAGVTSGRVGRPCEPRSDTLCGDGTSFAAPHVAGLAALLLEQHAELEGLAPAQRARRIRQWLLGTARDLGPTPSRRGVDLETGHGMPDAVAAATTSIDRAARLLTWAGGARLLSPTRRLQVRPSRLPLTAVVTDGTGVPQPDVTVTFAAGKDAIVSSSAETTDAAGEATTVLRSTGDGRRVRIAAGVGGQSLRLQTYVLDRDDDIPGVKAPGQTLRGRLRLDVDQDDVFRFNLRDGETMRGRLRGVVGGLESIDMYLHHERSTNVATPERAPLREDTPELSADGHRLAATVSGDGVRYLDVYGYGTYRLHWSIFSPGKVRAGDAWPATFTPDGDGVRDTTRITWRQRRAGTVAVQIRNADGDVIRAAVLGRRTAGDKRYRWDGRTDSGALASAGRYRATVRWENGRGRVSTTAATVRLAR